MSLLWHMVRKDARRLALPVALWMALPVVATAWLSGSSWKGDARDLAAATNWIRMVATFANLCGLIFLAGGVVLAGYLALEDRVVGSDSFWQTRPISGRRLLAAKAVSAFLWLIAAPLLALLPVWAIAGMAVPEICRAAGLTVLVQLGLVFGALALASLTENLGVHVFAVLVAGSLGLAALFSIPETWLAGAGSLETARVRDALAALVPVPIFAFVVAYQYLTRRCWAWPIVLVLMAVAVVGVRVVWRWDLATIWPSLGGVWPTDERGGLGSRESLPVVGLRMRSSEPEVVHVDVGARLDDGTRWVPWSGEGALRAADGRRVEVQVTRAEDWGQSAAVQVVHPALAGMAWHWPLIVTMDPRKTLRPGETRPDLGGAEFSGRMRLMRMRAHVVAEVPLRPDAEWKDGVGRLRVIGWTRGNLSGLLIEEHEARPAEKELHSRDGAWQDFFMVVDRGRGTAQPLRIREVGSANSNGVVIGLRVLEWAAVPERADVPEGAVLVKVRFEREERLVRTLTDAPIKPWSGEGRP